MAAKEVEFFIEEDYPQLQQWAKEKKKAGAVSLSSSEDVLDRLIGMTEADEPVSCTLSGAWLDRCIRDAVSGLLSLERNPAGMKKPVVTAVTVDLRTCYSYADIHGELSPEARGQLLRSLIGIHAKDPRLTLIPAPPEPSP